MTTNIQLAFLKAEQIHKHQLYDGKKYTNHLMDCYNIGKNLSLEEDLLIALILHDTLETDQTQYQSIKKEFGEKVAEIVYNVTDELGRNRKERKAKTYPKIKKDVNAVIVKLIDRLANLEYSLENKNDRLVKMYQKENGEFLSICENYIDNPLVKNLKEQLLWKLF